MFKKGFLDHTSKEKGDSGKKSQGVSDKPKSLDMAKEAAKKTQVTEGKSSRDKAQQSNVGSSSSSNDERKGIRKGFLNTKNPQRDLPRQASSSKRETLEHAGKDKAQQSDVGSSSDSSKNAKIPENFEHIGGNTELAKAKVILLGEAHISRHNEDIVNFINAHAKKGDIVLVEGTQAGQEQDKLHEEIGKAISFGHLTTDKAVRIMKEKGHKKAHSDWIKEGVITPFRNDIKIYGWDDMNAYDTERKALINKAKIMSKSEDSKLAELNKQFSKIVLKFSYKRDEKMLETINNMRTNFPNETLFIVAGTLHTRNPIIQENLEKHQYITLEPNYELTENEGKNANRVALELYQEIE